LTPENEHRNVALAVIARDLERIMPDYYGSVRFNLHGGKVANVNIEESVRLEGSRIKFQRIRHSSLPSQSD